MNTRPYLLNFSLLVGACSLAASASAQDQTVNGNLFVNNSLDVNGNTASFGVNGANPGYSLIYTNGTPATVDFSASAPGVNWIWSQATNQPQLKLGNTNTLSLFAPGSALAAIILNPAGTSTFSQGLTVTGTFTASGGLVSPNGIVTGGATGLSLQAGGTGNQNITLVPTGTGVTTTAAPVTVTNATASTSTTTGALVVTGGVGVNGTLSAGNVTTAGTVNAGTLKVTNVDTSLTNLGLGKTNTANFGAINAADPSFFYPAPVAKVSHTATTGPFLFAPQVVTVAGNFAYVGSSSSTSFQILDITNPLLPVKRGALIGTGGAAANLSYPRGIVISGTYAYVTSQTNNALQVINITNPDAPVAAGSLLNGAGGAALSAPYGIAVAGTYAYIASSGSNALQIVNIANPAAPVAAGKLVDATALLGARAVAVAGNYAYVVSNTGNRFAVVNISNPAAPALVTSLAHNAAGPLLAGATAIELSGNYAYVTSATSNALQIIDITNPVLPVARGFLVTGTSGAQLTAPSALRVVGNTAYVTANGATKAVQVVDVSNPLAPTPKGQLLDGSAGAALNGPAGIAVSGNFACVAASSNNALQILRITSGGGFQVNGTTVLTTNSANDVLLGSGLPNAKVAIGTTNATARLTVAGTDTTATSAAANFTDSTGQSLLIVQNDGKVGIGTSTPTAKLDVVGDAKVSGMLTVGGQPVVTANQLGNYATPAQVAAQIEPYAKPTTLYNSTGTAIANVGSDGKVNFTNGLSVGSGATAATITPNSATYLNQTLASLGFLENPVIPTHVTNLVNSGNVTFTAITRSGGFTYVAGHSNGSATLGRVGSYVLTESSGYNSGFIAKIDATGEPIWVTSVRGDAASYFRSQFSALAVDAAGNVIAAGSFYGALTQWMGPTYQPLSLSSLDIHSGLIVKIDANGVRQWAQMVQGSSTVDLRSVAVDTLGNVVVAGNFFGSITNLGGVANVTAAGSYDGLVVEFNSAGVVQWAKAVGGSSYDDLSSAAVDAAGNVVVAGRFMGSITNLGVANLASAGLIDGLVVKFNPAGVVQWAKAVGGTRSDFLVSVAVDAPGNVVVAGYFSASITNLGGAANVASAGSNDGLVVKFNPAGVVQWAKAVGGLGSDNMKSVAVDASGYVVVAGNAGSSINNLGGAANLFGTNFGFVLRLQGDGGNVDMASALGSGNITIASMALEGAGIYLAGVANSTAGVSVGDQRISGPFAIGVPSWQLSSRLKPHRRRWRGVGVTPLVMGLRWVHLHMPMVRVVLHSVKAPPTP